MKTLKKITAMLLAVVLVVVGGATAFASSADQTMVWNMYGEEFTVDYIGEITSENFAISAQGDGNEYVYYTYDAEESGYYMVTYGWYPVDDCNVAETIVNGEVTECKEAAYFDAGDDVIQIFYLEDGINYICFDRYFEGDDSVASIEFMGEEITDVILEEGALDDLIIDCDILAYEYEEGFEWWCDAEIVFSSGKSIAQENLYLCFEMNDPLAEGEISLTLDILGFTKEFTATAVEFDSIVTDVIIVDSEECTTVEQYYDGSINTDNITGRTIKVTFADGTSATTTAEYNYAEITFPNGRTYGFDVYYSLEDDGEYYCNVAFYTYEDLIVCASYVCETVDAGCSGNGEVLNDNISYPFDYAIMNFFENILNLDYATTIGEAIYVISETFGEMAVDYEYAFANLFQQLVNYLVRVIFA